VSLRSVSKVDRNSSFPAFLFAVLGSGKDGLHFVLGGLLLVLLEQLVATAHAPVVGLGQAGAVGSAGAGTQIFPVVASSPEGDKNITSTQSSAILD